MAISMKQGLQQNVVGLCEGAFELLQPALRACRDRFPSRRCFRPLSISPSTNRSSSVPSLGTENIRGGQCPFLVPVLSVGNALFYWVDMKNSDMP